MNALVTGASGFLGSHLVRQLLRCGYRIRGLVKPDTDVKDLEKLGIETVRGNLLDKDAVDIATRGIERVYHCAAVLPGKGSETEIWNVNVIGTKNLLDACLKYDVQRVVYVSTDSVYGDGDNPDSVEESPTNPEYLYEGNYPRSKLEGERIVFAYYRDNSLPVSIIRPCLMYGPGESSGNDILKHWASKRIHFPIDGGRAKLSLLYVGDAARAMILAGSRGEAIGQCYNISDGIPYSKREILKIMSETFGKRKILLSVPAKYLCYAISMVNPVIKWFYPNNSLWLDKRHIMFFAHNHVINISKAKNELGYYPKILLREGLRKTFAGLALQERMI